MRRLPGLLERVRAERGRDLRVCSSVVNVTGRAPVCRTSARSFASWMSPMPVICAPFEPLIPFGYCSQSIEGHDLISRSSTIAKPGVIFWPPPSVFVQELAAVRDVARDLGELVRAGVRELHRHDRLAGRACRSPGACRRASSPRPSSPGRPCPPRSPLRCGRSRSGSTSRCVGFAVLTPGQMSSPIAAAEDGRLGRHAEDAPRPSAACPLRRQPRPRRSASSLSLSPTGPARIFFLSSKRYQRRVRAVLDQRLLAGEQRVERLLRDREALRADRGRHEVRLEVEELELGGLAEDLDHLLRVLHPGEVDRRSGRRPACGSRAPRRRAGRRGRAGSRPSGRGRTPAEAGSAAVPPAASPRARPGGRGRASASAGAASREGRSERRR